MDEITLKASLGHSERGRLLAEQEDLDGALKELKEAIRLDPRNIDAIITLAEIHTNTGDYKQALKYCQEALMYEHNNIQAWITMGNIYDEMGEFDEALKQLGYATQYAKDNADIYYLMGYIYAEKEDMAKAAEFMEKCLDIDPEHEEAIRDLEAINEMAT